MSRPLLWAPWRAAYVSEPKPEGCFLCAAAGSEADRDHLVLIRGKSAFVMLNRYPYAAGHCMVVPVRHLAAPEDLGAEEAAELWALMVTAKGAMGRALRAEGYNVGFNLGTAAGAGVRDHLHLHLVARWHGDTNFLPALGGVRVVSQDLLEVYDLLASHLREEHDPGTTPADSGSSRCSPS